MWWSEAYSKLISVKGAMIRILTYVLKGFNEKKKRMLFNNNESVVIFI